MNVITKFLEQYSYRFPKGYPDVTNLEDKALLYKILEELDIQLEEGTLNQNSKKAKDILFQKYPDIFSPQTENTRIGNKAKISEDDFIKIIQDTFNITPEVFAPGTPENSQQSKPVGSSKYSMFKFKTDEGDVILILSGGPKAETSERQERSLIDTINSVQGSKNLISANGSILKNVLSASKVESSDYRYEPYADLQLEIEGRSEPYLVSAKGPVAPSLAGGGLAGVTTLSEGVRQFVKDFYEEAFLHYQDIFDDHEELTLDTDLYKTSYFKDINKKLPDDIILEILRGTEIMGGPVNSYYIGSMEVTSEIDGNNITLNGNFIPIEKFAEGKTLYAHIKKRSGSYFFTDKTQTVNGLTLPLIFTDKPGGKMAKSRFGILDKPRGKEILD
jgi:hypothetical protein